MNDIVYALAVAGTNLYSGGNFSTAGGMSANRMAKWNPATGWSGLGSGMDDTVAALAVLGTNLYAGGYFTTAGGISANGVAKWNPATRWSALGSGFRPVNAMVVSGG